MLERPENQETTSLGAALAAGLATGVWKGFVFVFDQTNCDIIINC
jgi:glycerol kinase